MQSLQVDSRYRKALTSLSVSTLVHNIFKLFATRIRGFLIAVVVPCEDVDIIFVWLKGPDFDTIRSR